MIIPLNTLKNHSATHDLLYDSSTCFSMPALPDGDDTTKNKSNPPLVLVNGGQR